MPSERRLRDTRCAPKISACVARHNVFVYVALLLEAWEMLLSARECEALPEGGGDRRVV